MTRINNIYDDVNYNLLLKNDEVEVPINQYKIYIFEKLNNPLIKSLDEIYDRFHNGEINPKIFIDNINDVFKGIDNGKQVPRVYENVLKTNDVLKYIIESCNESAKVYLITYLTFTCMLGSYYNEYQTSRKLNIINKQIQYYTKLEKSKKYQSELLEMEEYVNSLLRLNEYIDNEEKQLRIKLDKLTI